MNLTRKQKHILFYIMKFGIQLCMIVLMISTIVYSNFDTFMHHNTHLSVTDGAASEEKWAASAIGLILLAHADILLDKAKRLFD